MMMVKQFNNNILVRPPPLVVVADCSHRHVQSRYHLNLES